MAVVSDCEAILLLLLINQFCRDNILTPMTDGSKYYNYRAPWTLFDAFFGANSDKLRAVKKAYDPKGLLRGMPGLE